MSDDLAAFLLARYDEDETAARAATDGPWESHTGVNRMASLTKGDDVWIGDVDYDPDAEHIARHDPARVLAECDAKRLIVEQAVEVIRYNETIKQGPPSGSPDFYVGHDMAAEDAALRLRWLAAPYASHPDFVPSWSVGGQAE